MLRDATHVSSWSARQGRVDWYTGTPHRYWNTGISTGETCVSIVRNLGKKRDRLAFPCGFVVDRQTGYFRRLAHSHMCTRLRSRDSKKHRITLWQTETKNTKSEEKEDLIAIKKKTALYKTIFLRINKKYISTLRSIWLNLMKIVKDDHIMDEYRTSHDQESRKSKQGNGLSLMRTIW